MDKDKRGEFDMAVKTDAKTLGRAATGTLGPEGRNIEAEVLANFYERLATDEFYVPVPTVHGRDVTIPCGCVDGRCGAHLVPNAAGGTETIVIADALTTERQRAEGQTVAEHIAAYADFLIQSGLSVGGHGDDGEHGPEGCGANKKLALILEKIVASKSEIAAHMLALGVTASDVLVDALADKAARLLDEGYAVTAGRPVYDALKDRSPETVATLRGQHGEVAVVINTKAGTTLDREALTAEFGGEIQAFNVDVWALKNAAELNSFSPEETDAKFAAMVMYNLATAMVLANSSLRIVVR